MLTGKVFLLKPFSSLLRMAGARQSTFETFMQGNTALLADGNGNRHRSTDKPRRKGSFTCHECQEPSTKLAGLY